jgi:hypothetical protein
VLELEDLGGSAKLVVTMDGAVGVDCLSRARIASDLCIMPVFAMVIRSGARVECASPGKYGMAMNTHITWRRGYTQPSSTAQVDESHRSILI